MPLEPFRFKQFSVAHDRCAFRVGTDGVLLAAWAPLAGVRTALDIGTGSGVIALILAQRSETLTVDGIEVHGPSAQQARENGLAPPWAARLHMHHRSLAAHRTESRQRYDLIVTNPPYFSRSTRSGIGPKDQARHNESLPFSELVEGARHLLNAEGSLCVILPVDEAALFQESANDHGLFCRQRTWVHSVSGRPPKRVLLRFALQAGIVHEEHLNIESSVGTYSTAYRQLAGDLYLAF